MTTGLDFIDPYTFVPLPDSIPRAAPAGHHMATVGNVCGGMTVTWTLLTPLLLPAVHDRVIGGRVVVPGSSVKGSVRSLHETLMGGCLRVVDEEFVPVYRQPAVIQDEGWWLGVVRESTRDGRATRVEVTGRTAWVPIEAARRVLGRSPRTGDSLELDDKALVEGVFGRDEVEAWGVRSGDGWVLIVGDSGTRLKSDRFFAAAGRREHSDEDIWDVPKDVWESYESLCDGTDDMRRIRQRPDHRDYKGWRTERAFAPVRWKGDLVGERRRVTGRLWPGDVIWVHLDPETGEVDGLAMAAIWRTHGSGKLGDRVPQEVCACVRWQELCLSCRLFGSANTESAEAGAEADQQSYAGHIRMGDAVADGVTTTLVERLAPLGAPRPGAGQFYLNISDRSAASAEGDLPSAYWGSTHDEERLRGIRGRKFYWHGDPALQSPPRHIARKEQKNEAMSGSRQLVPAGTVLTQRVTFDNISMAELGSVLLTLLPGLVLHRAEAMDRADYALRLGGGKPLGLGSCQVAVIDLEWQDAAGRYSGAAPTRTAAERFFASVVQDVVRLAAPAARRHWPALSRILRTDAVDPRLIWYPIGGEGVDRDRSFKFFNQTNGRFLEKSPKSIVPLPDPSPGVDQTLRTRRS
ncbi:hypothetical protein ACFYYP_32490 [Microbispora rosea]|uniref:hypothetical protein n=1 Tax=Microbispora rosea TaxID=58117 RepID=UPI0036A021D1